MSVTMHKRIYCVDMTSLTSLTSRIHGRFCDPFQPDPSCYGDCVMQAKIAHRRSYILLPSNRSSRMKMYKAESPQGHLAL